MFRYVLSLPVILFPYTLLLALCCLFTGFLMEPVFGNNGHLLPLSLAFCAVLAGVCALVVCVGALVKKSPGRSMARLNMLVKLCHIPAYLVIFALSLLCLLMSIWGIGLIIAFFFFDCAAIAMTGLIGVAAVLRNFREHRLTTRQAVLLGICQFVFCADVIACVLLYIRSGREPARNRNAAAYPGAGTCS